jgi:hypothetical protein
MTGRQVLTPAAKESQRALAGPVRAQARQPDRPGAELGLAAARPDRPALGFDRDFSVVPPRARARVDDRDAPARSLPLAATPVIPQGAFSEREADAAASAAVARNGTDVKPGLQAAPGRSPSQRAASPGGEPLAQGDLEEFSNRWSADLRDVRIHRDAAAAAAASRLGARAFAWGRDIYFGAGQYRPEGIPGRWLLAHELAHTVQYPRGPISRQSKDAALPAPKPLGTVSRLVIIIHKRRIDVHTSEGVFSYELGGCSLPVGNYKARLTVTTMTRTNKYKREESYTQAAFDFGTIMLPGKEDSAPQPVRDVWFSWGPPAKKGQADFTELIANSNGLSLDVTVNLENEIIVEKDNFLAFNDAGENFTGNADPKEASKEGGGPPAKPPGVDSPDPRGGSQTNPPETKPPAGGGGFGTGIHGGGPKANAAPFPASITGETEELNGAISAYTMRLDYTVVGPALIDQVGAASNWVDYKWELYDATQYVSQLAGSNGGSGAGAAALQATAEKSASQTIKQRDVLKEDKGDASALSATAAAGPRFQQAMGEQAENYRVSQQRLQAAIQEGDAGKAFWNSINTNETLVGVSAVVTAAGAGLTALADLVGGPSSEQEIPWKKPGVFVIRAIASPKPIVEANGSATVHAPSVATLIVHVQDPQAAAEKETQRLNDAEGKLQQARDALKQLTDAGLGDDDANVQQMRKHIQDLEAATTSSATDVLDKIIKDKEQDLEGLKQRYRGLKDYRPRDLRDLESQLEDLREQRKHAGSRVDASSVRALGTLISEVDGNRYSLLLQFEVVAKSKGGFTAKLSDVTSKDGIYSHAEANDPQSAANAVIDKFAGENSYGRGRLSIVVPSGGAGTAAAWPRLSRSVRNYPVDDRIAAQHLQNLAKAVAAIALVVPGAQEIAAVLGAAASVESLAHRAQTDTLRPDAQAIADLANILGAVALGGTKIGGAIVARGSRNLTIAVKAGDVAAEADALTTMNRGAQVAGASATAAKGIGYFQIAQFSVDTLEQLKQLQRQEIAGTITRAEARRRRLGIASAILQQTAAHASAAAEESRLKAEAQAHGPRQRDQTEHPADQRLRAAEPEGKGQPGSEAEGKGPGKGAGSMEEGQTPSPREHEPAKPPGEELNPPKAEGQPEAPAPKANAPKEKGAETPKAPGDVVTELDRTLTEGMVSQPANPANRADAELMYKNSVTEDRTREAALFYNASMNQYLIVQGDNLQAGVAGEHGAAELPAVGRVQAWKELLNGTSESGHWELVAHSHPNATGSEVVAEADRFPSGANGDAGILVASSIASGGAAKESRIDFQTEKGPGFTIFRFDPSAPLRYTVDYPEPATGTRRKVSFATMEEYHEEMKRKFGIDSGAVPDWIKDMEAGGSGGSGGATSAPAAPKGRKKGSTTGTQIDPALDADVEKAFANLEKNPPGKAVKTQPSPVTARALKQRIQTAWREAVKDNPALRNADMTTIGSKIHNYIAEINRRLAPSGWQVSVETKLGSLSSVPARWQNLTVRQFFALPENGHLSWLKDSLPDGVLGSKVRDLQPDMVLLGAKDQTIVWDLAPRESTGHLAKTLLYTHLLDGQGMSYVWETYWSQSAK